MKHVSLLIIFWLLLPVSTLASERVLVLNTTGEPPLSTDDMTGFVDEVVKEAMRRIGYKLETIRLPAERALKNANQGLTDGELGRVSGMSKLYPNLIQVPEKVMDWEFVCFSYKPPSLAQGWSALSGKQVSFINGWKIYEKNVPKLSEVTKTKNAESLFNLLRKKRTDIILYERWAGHYLLHKMNMGGVMLCDKPLATKEIFLYLHKKHQPIVAKLSQAIKDMKQDKSFEALFNKHLMPLKRHSYKEHGIHKE